MTTPERTATVRRGEEPRGEARRIAVLEAVLRVVAREGTRGVTHRAVATEAGVSLRATTYYFTSRDDLLAQAYVHFVDDNIARIEAAATRLSAQAPMSPETAGQALAEFVGEELDAGLHRVIAEYELALEATRRPALGEHYERLRQALEERLAALTAAAGSATPETDARLIVAAVQGIELEAVARGGFSRADLEAACRRLVTALLSRP